MFLDKTKLVAHTFSTYIENLRIGVKAGMVRSKEECSAGLKSFKRRYLQVSLQGVKGMSCFLTKEQRANLKKTVMSFYEPTFRYLALTLCRLHAICSS